MDHLCYICLLLVMLSPLFIAALWSPERKGLTKERADLLALVCDVYCVFFHFLIWYPGTGVVLYCINS